MHINTTQSVTVAVPLILVLLTVYAVKHRKYKIGAVLLGFALGVSLAPTGLADTIATGITNLIIAGITALSGLFT